MPIPFDVYVCSMVFLSMIAGIIGLVIGISLALIVNIQPIAFAFLLPVIAGFGIGTVIFFVLQMLPAIHVKNRASKLIEELPDNQVSDVIDFVSYLKLKREKELFKELENASQSSMEFWDNDIDDEVWNNV